MQVASFEALGSWILRKNEKAMHAKDAISRSQAIRLSQQFTCHPLWSGEGNKLATTASLASQYHHIPAHNPTLSSPLYTTTTSQLA